MGATALTAGITPGLLVFGGIKAGGDGSTFLDNSGFAVTGSLVTCVTLVSFFSSTFSFVSTAGFSVFSVFDFVFSGSFLSSGTETSGLVTGVGGCRTGFIRTGAMGAAGGSKTGFIRTGAIGGGSAISSSLTLVIIVFLLCAFERLISLGVSSVWIAAFSSDFCFLRDGSDFSGVLLFLRCS